MAIVVYGPAIALEAGNWNLNYLAVLYIKEYCKSVAKCFSNFFLTQLQDFQFGRQSYPLELSVLSTQLL